MAAVLAAGTAACANAPTPTAWRQQWIDAEAVRRIDVGEGALCVLDVGEGPAVILLHGLGGSAYDWREAIGPLVEAGHRVVVPDMLGVAYSDHPPGADYCPLQQARRIREMARAMGIDRAALVGNSYGGGIAACLAIDDPEFVERLLLISPAIVPQTMPLYVGLARTPVLGDLMYAVTCKHCIVQQVLRRAWGPHGRPPESVVEEYAHEARFRGQRATMLAMSREIDDAETMALLDRVGEIRAPTRVLWGSEDTITPPTCGEELRRRAPQMEIVPLEGEGHVPHMANPARIVPMIVDFLSS